MGRVRKSTDAQGLRTTLPEASAAIIRARIGAFQRAANQIRAQRGEKPAPTEAKCAFRRLRISSRRAVVALDLFKNALPRRASLELRRLLVAARRAAGPVRDLDVLRTLYSDSVGKSAARPEVLAFLDSHRRAEAARVRTKLKRRSGGALSSLKAALLERVAWKGETKQPPTFGDWAAESLRKRQSRLAKHLRAPGETAGELHALRLRIKKFRYALELLGPALPEASRDHALSQLKQAQTQLGRFHDDQAGAEQARALAAERECPQIPRRELAALSKSLAGRARRARMEGLGANVRTVVGSALEHLFAPVATHEAPWISGPAVGRLPAASTLLEFKPEAWAAASPPEARSNGALHPHSPERQSHRLPQAQPGKCRMAAIDVGTNSIRLLIAEAGPDGGYRILDDEKENTRLGRGLAATGRLDPAAIEHTVVTIERMRRIAEGYEAGRIRVIGTAAAREARNADVLIRLVRERAGLDLEIVSAEQEAMLAYRSAALAFDLTGTTAAVVDIGGGSTEIILSAGAKRATPAPRGARAAKPGSGPPSRGAPGGTARSAGDDSPVSGGPVEQIYTVPIGAVKLTEMFGGADQCGADRFREMVEYLDRLLHKHVRPRPFVPQLLIGTGGTFTTLANILRQRSGEEHDGGLTDGSVQGWAVARPELKHVLNLLRKRRVRERAKIPGLPADRADIIVAGLTIVDRVLKRLRVNALRVHEGGVRDGLLWTMVEQIRGRAAESDQHAEGPLLMRSVKRFARACNYERAHSNHVAELSLQIFDQLASGAKSKGFSGVFTARSRELLHAAAVLHDVGYLINYSRHHKHSYHLIMHAGLAGLTSREVQVVANVARYHRCAEPKGRHRNFGVLSREERAQVRALSAVLRVADGLDRTHTQSIRAVKLRFERRAVHFEIESEVEPSVDLWGAARKAGLFRSEFKLLPHFEWHRAEHSSVTPRVGRARVREMRTDTALRSRARRVSTPRRARAVAVGRAP